MEIKGLSKKEVQSLKEKLKTVECNIKDDDLTIFCYLFMICFSLGVLFLFLEWFFLIPEFNLFVPCFVMGMIFLFPIMIQNN